MLFKLRRAVHGFCRVRGKDVKREKASNNREGKQVKKKKVMHYGSFFAVSVVLFIKTDLSGGFFVF